MTSEELEELLARGGRVLAAEYWRDIRPQLEPGGWDLLLDLRDGRLFARHQDRPAESWVLYPQEALGETDDAGWQPWDMEQ